MPRSSAEVSARSRLHAWRGLHPLLKCWFIVAVLYVVVAGAYSVPPVHAVVRQVRSPSVSLAVGTGKSADARREEPDNPALAVAGVAAKQAAIVLVPPLLTLWFGWDVWFAVVGFLEPRRRSRHEPDVAAEREASAGPAGAKSRRSLLP